MAEYTVHTDCEYTRRKNYHVIVDRHKQVIWKGKLWTDVLDWFYSQGVLRFRCETRHKLFIVDLYPLDPGKEPNK